VFVFTERCISIKKLLTRAAAGLFAQQPPEEVRCSVLVFILRICAGRRQKGRAFKYIAAALCNLNNQQQPLLACWRWRLVNGYLRKKGKVLEKAIVFVCSESCALVFGEIKERESCLQNVHRMAI